MFKGITSRALSAVRSSFELEPTTAATAALNPLLPPRPERRLLPFLCAVVVSVHLLIAMLYVAFLYSLFNKQIPTHLADGDVTQVQRLHFHLTDAFRAAPDAGAVSYCASGCSYFNPSMVLWRGRWIFAVRESTRFKCGGMIGTTEFALSQVRPKLSSVVLGEVPLDALDAPEAATELDVFVTSRLPDPEPRDPQNAHFGQEDPRLFVHGGELYLLSASERRQAPRMFLTRVVTDGDSPPRRPTISVERVRNGGGGGSGGGGDGDSDGGGDGDSGGSQHDGRNSGSDDSGGQHDGQDGGQDGGRDGGRDSKQDKSQHRAQEVDRDDNSDWFDEQDGGGGVHSEQDNSVRVLRMLRDRSERDGLSYSHTVELVPQFPGAAYPQKNWMYIPATASSGTDIPATASSASTTKNGDVGKGAGSAGGDMLFVIYLSPLTIVRVDVTTGAAELEHVSRQPAGKRPPSFPFRGSSAFLPLDATGDNTGNTTMFIGLAHEAQASGADLGSLQFPSYFTYFVVLERHPTWRVSHVSHAIVLPKRAGQVWADRITFATTLVSWRDEYIIAFGDMDCEAFMLRFKKDTVLTMLGVVTDEGDDDDGESLPSAAPSQSEDEGSREQHVWDGREFLKRGQQIRSIVRHDALQVIR